MNKAVKWCSYTPSKMEDTRTVRLLSKEIIADKTFLLTFEKPKGLTYKAGQYAVLQLHTPIYTHLDMPLRPLSMVSHPSQATLKFAMRISNSSFKRSIMDMSVGDKVTIFAPMGDFILRNNGHVVFFVAGIGITPVVSMLKELELQHFIGHVTLCYSCKNESAAAFHKDLKQCFLPNYTYLPVFTQTQKRIDKDYIYKNIPHLLDSQCYIIGTHSFVKEIETILLEQGVQKEDIMKDDFN